jgi:hypothetical protein
MKKTSAWSDGKAPEHLTDIRVLQINNRSGIIDRIWRIGLDKDWYYGTWLWKIRGSFDKFIGGMDSTMDVLATVD